MNLGNFWCRYAAQGHDFLGYLDTPLLEFIVVTGPLLDA